MPIASPSNNAEASSSRLPRAPRVSQVDADELDEGLVSMLGERLKQSLGNFKSTLAFDLRPEIALFLKLVIFQYAVFGSSTPSTPGARLQNLKLASSSTRAPHPSRRTLLLYLILHPPIFPTYLLNRLRTYALSSQWPDLPPHDWRQRAWKKITQIENLARAWELLGWGWFLWDGRYPSLLMRILGLRLIPSSAHVAKLVSYEFMNRQLVWGVFTEFMMFAVPLLPSTPAFLAPSVIIPPIKAFLSQPESIDYTSIPLLPRSNSSDPKISKAHSGPLAHLPMSTCPLCYLRYSSTPQPISATSTGSHIALPPLTIPGERDIVDEEGKEEMSVFVPAQTDCWGCCRWCYYCVAGELATHRQAIKNAAKIVTGEQKKDAEAIVQPWMCLRCGGDVSRAWRVGAEP